MKKLALIGIALSLSLLLSGSVFASANNADNLSQYYPVDINEHWAADKMTDFIQSGILEGYQEADGTVTVKPDHPITRAEFVTLLVRANELEAGSSSKSFSDVGPSDWYYEDIRIASSLGIVDGFDNGTFAPDRNISREEISAIIVRAFKATVSFEGQAKSFTDTSGSWAKSYIADASAAAIVDGYDDGSFKPEANAKRAEAMTMLSRALHKEAHAVPDDATLTHAVRAVADEQFEALSHKQYDQFAAAVVKYGEGFYHNSSLAAGDKLQSLEQQGFDVQMKQAGTPAYTVISKSDRYAAVDVKGYQIETTVNKGESSDTWKSLPEDTLYLHLTDGKWLVYGSKNDYLQLKKQYAVVSPSPAGAAAPRPSADNTAALGDKRLFDAKIVKVVDGDTMDVTFNGKKETVRLLLVDTPETVHPEKPVQPFGPAASQFAKDTLSGKDVKLEIDVSERDKYGRLLAYLYVGDRMFNEMLLEKGLARVAYVIPPNVKYVDQFRGLQKIAQQAGVGIWSIENYAQEDGFHEDAASEPAAPAPTQEPAATQPPEQESTGTVGAACENPTIKGNINSKGEHIYHVPGGQFYNRTDAESMFCTAYEAEAAGFRASQR